MKLGNGGVGRPEFTVLNLSCSGRTEYGLSKSSLITIFSAILVGLQTLYNDARTQHTT